MIQSGQSGHWAGELLHEFGSLGAILAARPEALARVVPSPTVARFIGSLRRAFLEILREEAFGRPVLSSHQAVRDYLSLAMAHAEVEEVRAIYLDAKNHLLRDEMVGRGSASESLFCARALLRRALEVNASAFILVHNHPSGDPGPSRADLEVTREIDRAARALGIVLHDHLIIARGGCTSLRSLGYI